MKKLLFSFTLAAAVACAQPALAPPQVGFVQDAKHSLRPVLGVAGNFMLGDAAASDIVAAAFSGSFGLYTTTSTLTATDREGKVVASQIAPAGPAMFAFSRDGDPALAYFPTVNLLLSWTGDSFQLVSFDWNAFPRGAVHSIAAPDPEHAAFLVQRQGELSEVRLLLETGAVESRAALPGVQAPALLLATGDLVYSDSEGFVVRHPDHSETHVSAPLPQHFALHQMGDGWMEVRDLESCSRLALRVTAGQETVYALPEVEQ